MKRISTIAGLVISLQLMAQDSTLVRAKNKAEGTPVVIFNSEKVINANSTEVVGKGKMKFKVSHSFGDIGGKEGGAKTFFGLDNATDIKIGFQIGIGKKLDMTLARTRGGSAVQQLWEINFKYQLMRQLLDEPGHPLSVALFANMVVSAIKADNALNLERKFAAFSDRLSQVIQLIIAKKTGKVSLQLNPTLLHRGYAIDDDLKTMFSLGGAIKVPLGGRMNLLIDYFHNFRSQASKDSFFVNYGTKFYDPLGIGFEILTPGHIFTLNFTNAKEILENRFIPRTVSSWGKGQFRWGFTISRTFTLWRDKK
jgi:hypothetical protein